MKLSQPTRILLALVVGLGAGIVAASQRRAPGSSASAAIAEPIGGLWLNALQMTIVPLVVALLITGIAASAEAARASRLATRALDPVRRPALDLRRSRAALLTPLVPQPVPAARPNRPTRCATR